MVYQLYSSSPGPSVVETKPELGMVAGCSIKAILQNIPRTDSMFRCFGLHSTLTSSHDIWVVVKNMVLFRVP